jgi:tetratricopeptide (TPR) repeat protein
LQVELSLSYLEIPKTPIKEKEVFDENITPDNQTKGNLSKAQVFCNEGSIFYALSNYEKAIDCYMNAVFEEPSNPTFLLQV